MGGGSGAKRRHLSALRKVVYLMSMEFFERGRKHIKPPADKDIEAAVEYNPAFLDRLNAAQSLEELKDIIRNYSLGTPDNEFVVFEIIKDEDGNTDALTFIGEDLLNGIEVIKNDPPLLNEHLEAEVRCWIEHGQVADAVVRILKNSRSHEETT